MIKSFADRETERIFRLELSRKLPGSIQVIARRKLILLDAAEALSDLRIPPGNQLEKMSGNRVGQYSIRINDQWRICFVWKDDNAQRVEIADYH
ncbi:MAG: plasmid maintenance system killer [Chloroflexi bacterium HGW-Chloroflexi-5]|jgi:proteic killer suppression protein|nr:MAG: plasmid maintenance system killer [Chloroflexi bacterium HGW-Chloroflexi-5]